MAQSGPQRRSPHRDDSGPGSEVTAPAGPLWIRQAQVKTEQLTLDSMISAAIALADAEGLEAVSIRRVAAVLKARPMSLYSLIARKDDLVELMVDRVIGETHVEHTATDWRAAVKAIARRTREVGQRHQWLMAAFGQLPHIGPNAIIHLEQALAAVAGLGLTAARAMALLNAVDAYTIGYGTVELAEREMLRRDGLTKQEWRASAESYFKNLASSRSLPHIAGLDPATLLGDDRDTFEEGLDWLLNGVAATLATEAAGSAPPVATPAAEA